MSDARENNMVKEGTLLWTPRQAFAEASNIRQYQDWLHRQLGVQTSDYNQLWQWSVEHSNDFWASIWSYFNVQSTTPYRQVSDRSASSNQFIGTQWFPDSQVNYAEHLLRYESQKADHTVFHHLSELRPLAQMTWSELGRQVRILATQLRALGIGVGDRVVSYMPNIPETSIAMMATVAIGAIWSSAAPEFGVKTVIDRFSQIEPKLIFVADGYRFNGKEFDRRAEIEQIQNSLPSLAHVVWLSYLNPEQAMPNHENYRAWSELLSQPDVAIDQFHYSRVAHDHPLWIVFSSGTTGLPKAIVHSHVGTLVEHYKLMSFHLNLSPSSTMFFYTTTGWMMWNLLQAALLLGSAIVLYDGSPTYPNLDFLWELAAKTKVTSFGASPTFVQLMEKQGLKPADQYDLSALESIVVSGAPSTPETFDWFYRCVKQDLWVTSQSGGTEICSGFVGASPTLPVYAGEIQTRLLGMDVHAWNDEAQALINEVGELVVLQPFPSMPLQFWNDVENKRYEDSYFEVFKDTWRHGDFIKINDRGGCYIYGRSDSTLNRYGVRIGTAEIYRTVEQIEGIADSLIVCCELEGGYFFMPLFVQLKDGFNLDESLIQSIKQKLSEDCSPRHIPDQIFAVPAIPYTLTAKKMEVPIRKLLIGHSLAKAASRDAMMNPAAIDWFVQFASRLEYSQDVKDVEKA